MKYGQRDERGFIKLLPEEGESIEKILFTLGKLSYEKATPKGQGFQQGYGASHKEVCFEDYLTYDAALELKHGMSDEAILGLFTDEREKKEKNKFSLDYIHGRDCRTLVVKNSGDWYFGARVFEQRKVTLDLHTQGIVFESATDFLDAVNSELRKDYKA